MIKSLYTYKKIKSNVCYMYYINNVRVYIYFSIGKSFKSQILSNLSNKLVNLLIIRYFSVTCLLLKIGC